MRSCLHTSMLLVLVFSGATDTSADQIDVPSLVEAVEIGDKTTRIAALCELRDARHLARKAVPAIARALEDEDEEVRAEAVSALENLGVYAEGAVPALVRTLSDETLCDAATDALASIGRPAVRELIQALDDKTPLVRESAVRALARIGPHAHQAVPRLIEVVRSDEKQLQTPAASALACIGAAAKPALPLLHDRLQSKDVQYRVEAAKALWEINRQIEHLVPVLIEILRTKNEQQAAGKTRTDNVNLEPSVREEAAELLSRIGPEAKAAVPVLIESLKDEDSNVRRAAADALGAIGREAKDAIPALVKAMRDEQPIRTYTMYRMSVGMKAGLALREIGSEAIPQVVPLLKDNRKEIRCRAIWTIASCGPAAREYIPLIIQAIEDDEKHVRQGAVEALGKAALAPEIAVPVLARILVEEDDYALRYAAAVSLCRFGPHANSATAALTQALGDENAGVRARAADALGAIGPDARSATTELGQLVTDDDWFFSAHSATDHVGHHAVAALREIRPDPEQAVPFYIRALRDGSWQARREAIVALGDLGPKAKTAVPDLLQWRSDLPETVTALLRIAPDHDADIPGLILAMRSGSITVDKDVVRSLGCYGLRARGALPALRQLLSRPDPDLQCCAACAILSIDANDPIAKPVFLDTLHDPRFEYEESSMNTLVRMGSRAEMAVPILCDYLLDADQEVRGWAAECLGRLNPSSERSIDALIRFLADREDYWNPRGKGIEALARIGPSAVPKLVAALKDEDVLIRAGCAEALGRIGPRAKPATESLVEALADPRMPVRCSAAEALGRIGAEASSAIPALTRARQDEFASVRQRAEEALARIQSQSCLE